MKRSVVAALLSLLIPGLGQAYNRDFFRAVLWLIFGLMLSVSLIPLGMGLGSIFYHLLSAWSAYKRSIEKYGRNTEA